MNKLYFLLTLLLLIGCTVTKNTKSIHPYTGASVGCGNFIIYKLGEDNKEYVSVVVDISSIELESTQTYGIGKTEVVKVTRKKFDSSIDATLCNDVMPATRPVELLEEVASEGIVEVIVVEAELEKAEKREAYRATVILKNVVFETQAIDYLRLEKYCSRMVTRLKILVLFVLTWNVVSAQDLLCGTQAPTLQQQERLNQLIASEAIFDINVAVPISEIAIVAHVIRRSDGTGGLTETQLNDALDNVNDFYSNANMSFFFLDINYIDEDKYFSFVTSDEAEMTAKYNYEGVINIYFCRRGWQRQWRLLLRICIFPGWSRCYLNG